MGCSNNGYARINQFALVSYIPDPLRNFLDLLRLRLAPECRPHAHVTILPPRPLQGTIEQAEAELRKAATRFYSFDVKLGDIKIFDQTDVIYIEVEKGERELRNMYRELNAGAVKYQENYEFHPHITLAQNLPHEQIAEAFRLASQFWSEWHGPIEFPVEELSFVQNTEQKVWLDLMHVPLIQQPAEITR